MRGSERKAFCKLRDQRLRVRVTKAAKKGSQGEFILKNEIRVDGVGLSHCGRALEIEFNKKIGRKLKGGEGHESVCG